ncbi:MAG: GntR family transcriptional regulator [Lachnospiraceae bacterium]|nr:GntR family transcriptional regulator [Lachnospiraceae bacterium]
MPNRESLKDSVYNRIMEDIFCYEYQAGNILNEKALMEKYGCSKTPVREALLSLCDDQVLKSIPRYGYEIIRLTTEDISEMIQYRFLLEGGMLHYNYERLTGSHFRKLEEINELIRENSGDVWAHWQYNAQFHQTLTGFCGNEYALEALTRCMNRLKRAYAQFYWGKWAQSVPPVDDTRHHVDILNALRAGDPDEAQRCLALDLNDFGGLKISLPV